MAYFNFSFVSFGENNADAHFSPACFSSTGICLSHALSFTQMCAHAHTNTHTLTLTRTEWSYNDPG